MATKVNIYESYGEVSARERAELIYSNYSSFEGIIEDCKMRLIYDIKAEKEYIRSHHKDELGVRIQNLGRHSDPTADEGDLDVMLEGATKGENSLEDIIKNPAILRKYKRKEYVIVRMADEYEAFDRHLHAIRADDQELIIPILKRKKDYFTVATEKGVPIENIRRRASRIHREIISFLEDYYTDQV